MNATTICFLIFFPLGCAAEGLQWGDGGSGGAGGSGGGPVRGPASFDVPDVRPGEPDVQVADAQLPDQRTPLPDLLPDVRSLAEVGVEAAADTSPIVVSDASPEIGREVSTPEAGPELQVSPDLRPVLPETGPEAKKCAPECNTGCNVGCRADGQCQACATCTCEVASGTCHC